MSNSKFIVTLILLLFLGIFGVHRFYNKKYRSGILMLITLGGLGIWVLVDLILLLNNSFKDQDGNIISSKKGYFKYGINICSVIVFILINIMIFSAFINNSYVQRKVSYIKDTPIINNKDIEEFNSLISDGYGISVDEGKVAYEVLIASDGSAIGRVYIDDILDSEYCFDDENIRYDCPYGFMSSNPKYETVISDYMITTKNYVNSFDYEKYILNPDTYFGNDLKFENKTTLYISNFKSYFINYLFLYPSESYLNTYQYPKDTQKYINSCEGCNSVDSLYEFTKEATKGYIVEVDYEGIHYYYSVAQNGDVIGSTRDIKDLNDPSTGEYCYFDEIYISKCVGSYYPPNEEYEENLLNFVTLFNSMLFEDINNLNDHQTNTSYTKTTSYVLYPDGALIYTDIENDIKATITLYPMEEVIML